MLRSLQYNVANVLRVHFTFLVALLPAVLCAATRGDFDVRPAPSWVERLSIDTRVDTPKGEVRYGVYAILSDHQIRVTNESTTDYYRRVRKILTPKGVQNASELAFDFDPSYQRLLIHEIAILRGGARIDDLRPEEIRIIEKEDGSNDRIYDGMLTALVFLNDVRPGDVIDYSWSIDGANPILAGRYADEYDLTSPVPARLVRHRLIWPVARPLSYRSSIAAATPRVEARGNAKVFTWERLNVPPLDLEDGTPDWYNPWDNLEVTDYRSWAEVARWADAMFQIDAVSRAEAKRIADGIRSAHADREGQIVAATRFVQDEIRYLGIEMGRNSHEPHQPAVTLEQRWGDCKDKSLLLSALLHELGIEAYPALVNTKLRRKLDDRLPSPFAFDHVITKVILDRKSYWIDATISEQGGTLGTIETPNDERALVVRPDTTALTAIETNERGSTVIEQTYTTRDYASPTTLEVRSTYSGADADTMRSSLAAMSFSDLAREQINRYAIDQPKIRAAGLPKISDDRLRNRLVIAERYTIRDLWKTGKWSFYPRAVEQHLHRPDTMIRSMPLAFDHPLDITQRLTFNLPEEFEIERDTGITEDSAFRYEYSVDRNGRTVTITYHLRALRDSVPVAEVPDHLTKLNEVWNSIGQTLSRPQDRSAAARIQSSLASMSASGKIGWTAGLVLALIGIAVAIAVPRRRASRRTAIPLPPTAFRPGEAPSSALVVDDPLEMEAHLVTTSCVCGAIIDSTGEISRARYDERELTIVTRRCDSCGREQSLYFRQPFATAG